MELFKRAQSLHVSGKFDEAMRLYDDLLTQNHDNPGLLAQVGTLFLQKGYPGLAISIFEQAAEKAVKYPNSGVSVGDLLCNLGIAYRESGQHEKCREAFGRAMKKDPSPETVANYAGLFINVGTPEIAEKYARQAIAMKPDNALGHWSLAVALLEQGKWEKAWEHHEWAYKTHPPMRIDRKLANLPMWDGTPGKKLAIWGEQGLGDEIMFASMIPDVMRDNEVTLECHTRLKTLFEKSFGVPCYGNRESKDMSWADGLDLDARISIASLGRFYRTKKDDFHGTPYLKAESAPKGNKFRVGISWTGGLKAGRVATRSVPLAWWRSILNNSCEFVSLQYTDCKYDLDMMDGFGYSIKRPEEVFANDYYETAKLVKSCDLVISICTSVVHLAGALGVPCWCLTPHKVAWRYGVKGPMPWYRSVRLYRQQDGQSWKPVVERIGYDLSELLDRKAAA